jgi:cysteine desulfurase
MHPIYLDYNATTPVEPEVFEAMLPFLREQYGNPSSTHPLGRRAADAVAEARSRVATLIGASPDEVVFTAHATEANNLALLGVAAARSGAPGHLVISAIEHPAVAAPAARLRDAGWSVSVVPVDRYGRVAPDDVEAALRSDTVLVSVMHANNEVGSVQPVHEIGRRLTARGILLHTDAAQSVGKIAVKVDALSADLLTLAGHKFYGPKGVGALYVRRGTALAPVVVGAEQERGVRPGTENVAGIVGLGMAALLAHERCAHIRDHLAAMRDELQARLQAAVPGLDMNGSAEHRLPNTLHISFPGVSGKDLLDAVQETVAASVGSACHSDSDAPSGVLAAMGLDARRARGAVRLSVGSPTTPAEVAAAATALASAWQHLRGGKGSCAEHSVASN